MEEQLVVLMDPWHEKYNRLLEAHEKLQKLNQTLEEKLLKLAETHHIESQKLSRQINELTQRLVEARLYIHQLEEENDRYRNDINVVVQLLHCKPSNFVSPKLDTLPDDLQKKVLSLRNGSNCKKEKKIIKVQVPTYPPTDLHYSVDKGKGKKNGSEKDTVSAAIMAKILEEREKERIENRKNRCKCASKIVLPLVDAEAQTLPACTISYADFNFTDFESGDDDEEEDEEVIDDEEEEEVEEDEEDDDDIIYERKTTTTTTMMPTMIPQAQQNHHLHHHQGQPSSIAPSKGSPSNKLVSVSSSSSNNHHPHSLQLQPSVDDIMKTDQKEEELLPTPLFLRRNTGGRSSRSNNGKHEGMSLMNMKQESQDSTYSSGSSNCNTTTNSSNSNISHSSRISSGSGTLEEELIFSKQSHPSPTSTIPHSSVSSASPDIQNALNQIHFFDDFDPDTFLQDFGIINQGMTSIPHVGGGGGPLVVASSSRTAGTNNNSNSNNSQSNSQNHPSSSSTSSSSRPAVRSQSINFLGTSSRPSFGWESHFRSTVLVHHPPKSHSSYEPLALTSTRHNTSTFSAVDNELVDSPELEHDDDNSPLLESDHLAHQYYRSSEQPQRPKFWSRSRSTTETEI